MIIHAKNYKNRKELDRFINAEIGIDLELNKSAGHSIEGNRVDLKNLRLNDTSSIFGIKCVIKDTPTKDNLDKKASKIKKSK